MQPRLTRSTTDKMIAGVSGGLGEYFNIDPVIVRLIFVLVTFTSGMGVPIYLVLWMITPQSGRSQPTPPADYQQNLEQMGQQVQQMGQQFSADAQRWANEAREVMLQRQGGSGSNPRVGAPPPPAEYRFDPVTGQPIQDNPATGRTVNLGTPPFEPPMVAGQAQPQTPYTPPTPRRNWSVLGTILIGIGGLIFLEQLGINLSILFPVLLIVAGIVLMRRHR